MSVSVSESAGTEPGRKSSGQPARPSLIRRIPHPLSSLPQPDTHIGTCIVYDLLDVETSLAAYFANFTYRIVIAIPGKLGSGTFVQDHNIAALWTIANLLTEMI